MDSPVTKKDMEDRFEKQESLLELRLQQQTTEIKEMFAQQTQKFIDHMENFAQEMHDHFDAAVEKIEEDLKGANHDEISLLKNKSTEHEERIVVLENRAGLR